MTLFLVICLIGFARRSRTIMHHGFYVMVAFYCTQRFFWEFLNPSAAIAGPLNVFHFLCLALIAYAAIMMRRTAHDRTAA